MPTLIGQQIYTLGDSIYFLGGQSTWDIAQTEARSYGGNLVTINNREEQIFLAGLFAGQAVWIGFNDAQTEGTFRWISGETSTYTNWEGGQPDNGGNVEDFAVLQTNGSWYDYSGNNARQGIVEIRNPSTPIFIIEDLGIIEPASGSKQVLFTVKRYGNPNQAVTIDYSTQDDTARNGIDYQAVSGQLSFNAGETSKTIAVNILRDSDTITKERFFLNLTSLSGNGVLGDNQAIGTIRETVDAVTFGGKTYLLTNTGNWGQAQVEARTYGGNLVTINDVAEQTFLAGVYAGQASWIGYSDAGAEGQDQWQWITDPTAYTNWERGQPDNGGNVEDFAVLETNGSWYDYSGNNARQGIVEIPDSLSLPLADLTTEPVFTLGDSIYLLTPQASNWGQAQVSAQSYQGNLVTINNREEQTFLAGLFAGQAPWIGYSDSGVEGTFRWISGETSTYTNWERGQPDNGGNVEDFAVLETNGSWYDYSGNNARQGIVEIKNPSTPIFIIEDLGIIEPASGSKQVLFTVKRYGNPNQAVTIDYSTQDDTARDGLDYQAVSGQLSFNAGETSKTIAVNILRDSDTITRERFFLNLTSLSGNGVLGDNQAIGTIRETGDAVTFGGKTYLLTNTGNWGQAQVEARTYGGNLVTINDVAEQTFLAGVYAGQASWIGYSDAGAEGQWQWITDPTAYTNWAGGQPDNGGNVEDFAVLETNGSWYDYSGNNARQGIVEIPPQATALPTITLAVLPASVTEDGAANLVYTFTRRGGSLASPLTVNYNIGGTATNGTDYGSIPTSVNFAANSATAQVIVNPTPDTTVEPNETVALTLVNNAAYTIGTTGAVTGTIINTPTNPSITLSVNPSGISEDSPANFVYTFTRTGSTSSALAVNFSIGGTATFNNDYVATGATSFNATTGKVTFAAGASTATVTLNPTGDTTVETGEIINLTLASGTGYTLGTTTAITATIINDDGTRRQKGTNGNDVILGTSRSDILIGDLGNDELTGGANSDTFSFQAPNQGSDRLTDFSPGNDIITVSGSGFSGAGLIAGDTITSAQLVIGTAATNSSQRFIYNRTSGALLFDKDGNGSTAAVGFATLGSNLNLTFEDIFVG